MAELKELFERHQKLLLKFANTQIGRDFLGIKEKEQIVKLTSNSYHRLLAVQKDNLIIEGKFWESEKFAKKLALGLTSLDIINQFNLKALFHYLGLRREFIYPQILFTTTVFNPGTGEGRVYTYTSYTTWALAHDAVTGEGVLATCLLAADKYSANSWGVSRVFHPIDTSSIPDDNIITAATFYGYRDDTVVALSNTDLTSLDLVQSTQASDTALVVADFDALGTDVAGSVAFSATTDHTYFTIVLNATGRSWISKTGYTKLAIRVARDTANSAPTGVNEIGYQNRSGAYPPCLEVTYSSASGAFLAFL